MKKSIATFLTGAIMVCSVAGLAACNNGGNGDNGGNPTAHTHTPGNWINNDPAGHYKLCTATDCDNPTEKLESATHDTNGTGGSCSVCGYAPGQITPDPATPEEALKAGFYAFEYDVPNMGAMTRALKFYDDIAYYLQDGGGGTQHYVYYYELEEKDYPYEVWYTAEEAGKGGDNLPVLDKHSGTANYTITFTGISDSSLTYSFGFDGEYIYTPDKGSSFLYGDAQYMRLVHNADKDAEYGAKEVGQTIVSLCAEDDETKEVLISHDGTYEEYIGHTEGTWTLTKGNDGKVTYTLTPEDSGDTGATVVVNADGKSGTYTPAGGTVVNLVAPAEKVVVLTFTGEVVIQPEGVTTPITNEMNLYLYEEDEACAIYMTNNGQPQLLDRGTYELNTETGAYSFDFDTFGEIIATVADGGSATVHTIVIPADTTENSGRQAATLTASIKHVLHTLTGMNAIYPAKLELLGGGSAVFTVDVNGTLSVTEGTWTNEKATFDLGQAGTVEIALTFENGVITGTAPGAQPGYPGINLTNVLHTLTGKHYSMFDATLQLCDGGVAVYTVDMGEHGGTTTSTGTWTDEKATIGEGESAYDITLTNNNGVITGSNSAQIITLTNVIHTLTGKHYSMFDATLQLCDGGVAVYTVDMGEHGGTTTSTGTWTGEKATFGEGESAYDITLTNNNGVITGSNSTYQITLSNQPAEEGGESSGSESTGQTVTE